MESCSLISFRIVALLYNDTLMAASCSSVFIAMLGGSYTNFLYGATDLLSSPVAGCRCVGLGVAYTVDVLLTGFDATVSGGAVAHFGEVMSRLRGCSNQDGLSFF